ncbi:CCC motif membrane protein [Lacinutrix salivirga]
MNYNKLPADNSAQTLGIIALVIVVLGCCCGFVSVISLILSIVGLVNANKSIREYLEHPESYSPNSFTNVKNAKIINIIALIISGIITLFYVAYFFIYGAFVSTVVMEALKERDRNSNYQWEQDSTFYENDSIYYEEDTFIIESDSINLDSINTKELNEKTNSEN